ncbi:hypothetical protein GOARA_002_00020 [Gordonia araii NBRC 100433]|uniref:Uncharacterized protein n=1 Tax=Gordonia araii NBRC 100433 TaxID=1073574 RepID=G7GX32_9ACTN|nr:hypothetical protein [Gordonia araii]NNG99280.1 hypothetical protein [Gordonia araii NBRC 100433]GAB08157.1 hypothetical protein GOARA_002_00020 [Gordonia araii NBRC 100433]
MSNPNTETDTPASAADTEVIPAVGDNVTRSARQPSVTPPAPTEPTGSAGVPAATLVFWLLGCLLLVVAAVALPRLSEWAGRYGNLPVFLGFFLVMSLAGRWFWAGTDAIISAVRGRG